MGLRSVTNPRLRLTVHARGRADDRIGRRVVVAACDRLGDDQVMSWAKISSMRGATISVRVQPRSRSDALVGLRDGVLVVRVVAPPLDGRANDALCRLLADLLGVRRSRVTIMRGERTRDKVVAIEGIDQPAADAAVRSAVERSSIS
jgi:uncharacterized protein